MVFAIDEINGDQTILPNFTLGTLIYNTCSSAKKAIKSSLQMLTGQEKPIPNYKCKGSSLLTAVIGESSSTISVSIARLLGLYRFPQVSYFSTSPLLNNKDEFPSFFRTIPSDDSQAQGLLLHYMKGIRFKNRMGEEIFFDKYGSPPAAYDIINWQHEPDGTILYVKVGSFDKREPRGQELNVNKSALWWTKQGKEVPHSVCSEKCNTGYHKAGRKGQPVCCYDCIPCSEGQMSIERDSSKCWPCPSDQWPNKKQSDCEPKRFEVLSYTDPVGAILCATVMLCSIITTTILFVFIKFQETAIVKANNRNLTYLLILSLVLSFLCSLLFFGEPQPITCLLRQTAFGIMFALCISCVLAKTIMVFVAFRATKPDRNRRKWLGPRIVVLTVSASTLIQVLICASWLLFCPPFPEKNMKIKIGIIIYQCNECSLIAMWCMLGYLGLLACISFLVAFLVRKLPDSFNEAKWITFSMVVFLSVWLTFIPGYLSTQGKYMVAVEVFSIICSCAGILVCIFLPKCYILLLRPDLNTRQHLLGKESSLNRKIKSI
ncbi:vomeronasal type-2 receptor 26-like [Lissotriton helveticus]